MNEDEKVIIGVLWPISIVLAVFFTWAGMVSDNNFVARKGHYFVLRYEEVAHTKCICTGGPSGPCACLDGTAFPETRAVQ